MSNPNPASGPRRKQDTARRTLLSFALLLGLGSAAAPAFADWQVDDDVTQQKIKDLQNEMRDRLQEIYKQSHVKGDAYNVDAHKSLTLQYSDSGSQTQGDISGTRDVPKATKSEIDALIKERCPQDSSNPQSAKQQPLCQDIVEREARLRNYMLDMLALARDRQQELKEIIQERQKINSGDDQEMGQIQSNTNRLLAFQAQQQIDEANYRLTVASYDRYLTAQRAQLADAAKRLAQGSGGTGTGAMTSAAMLEAALALAPHVTDLLTSF